MASTVPTLSLSATWTATPVAAKLILTVTWLTSATLTLPPVSQSAMTTHFVMAGTSSVTLYTITVPSAGETAELLMGVAKVTIFILLILLKS